MMKIILFVQCWIWAFFDEKMNNSSLAISNTVTIVVVAVVVVKGIMITR